MNFQFERLEESKFKPLCTKQMMKVLGGQATGSGSYTIATQSRQVTQTVNGREVTVTQTRELRHGWDNDFDHGPGSGGIEEINGRDYYTDWQ